MLSDVALHSATASLKKSPALVLVDFSAMTDGIQSKYAETMSLKMRSVSVQTEAVETNMSTVEVSVSKEIVALIESELCDSISTRIGDKMLQLHSTSKVHLQLISTYSIPLLSTETLSVLSISCGSARKTAILVGEQDHESWCSHEGKVIISRRNKCTSLTLPVCPSNSSWSAQGVLAVGDVAGDIHIVVGESITRVFKIHTQAVSGLQWVTHTQLISCGEDGNITCSHLKNTTLETTKTVRLSICDLPRLIRKSSSSLKQVSAVTVSGCGKEVCVATETGGLWIVSVPDLHLRAVHSEPQAVRTLSYSAPFIALSGDEGSSALLNDDGTLLELLPISARHICRVDELLVLADEARIIIYDFSLKRILLEEERNIQCMNVTQQNDVVILSGKDITTFRLVKTAA